MTTPAGMQLATVSTAGSYLSSSDKRVHFGLGAETKVNVEIHWPSGILQKLQKVEIDRVVKVDEAVESGSEKQKSQDQNQIQGQNPHP